MFLSRFTWCILEKCMTNRRANKHRSKRAERMIQEKKLTDSRCNSSRDMEDKHSEHHPATNRPDWIPGGDSSFDWAFCDIYVHVHIHFHIHVHNKPFVRTISVCFLFHFLFSIASRSGGVGSDISSDMSQTKRNARFSVFVYIFHSLYEIRTIIIHDGYSTLLEAPPVDGKREYRMLFEF